MQQPWVVEIGPKEIYDQLVSLNTKVELAMADLVDADKRDTDHEARLRSLERGRWPLPSIAVLVAVCSLAVAILTLMNRGTG